MNVAAWLAVGAVVLVHCGAYFLGLFRGRTDLTSRRRGVACLVFAVYVAVRACRLSFLDGWSDAWGRFAGALALLGVAPALAALVEGYLPRPNRLRSIVGAYTIVGALGLLALAFIGTPPFLDRVYDLPGNYVSRSGPELLALAYLCVALVASALVLVKLLIPIEGRQRPRAAVMFLAATFVLAAHDLHLHLTSRPGLDVGFELGLVLVALACLDETIRATTSAGEALQTQTDELAKSYAELRATHARFVRNEQLAAVGELSAVIAHEVRNPLAIIKNALSGLRRKSLRAEDRVTLLDILDEETDKLNRLMHDLLAYARPVAPRLQPVDLEDVLHRAVERSFGGVRAPVGLDVAIDTSPISTPLLGDSELLVHAVVNVIENALQAMPHGGRLSLSTSEIHDGSRNCVAIAIRDTGEGMDTTVRAKARDPFFTTRPTGTGLGLAIVERVLRNHGGHIEIESTHGEGTQVSLLLPLDRRSLEPIPIPESSSESLVFPKGLTP